MRHALNRVVFAALSLAVGLAIGSSANAQNCPTCGPNAAGGYGKHYFKTGEYGRYGGVDVSGYYNRGLLGPYSDGGDCNYRHYGNPDLFRQYYVPNNCGGQPAGMYPSPGPVPPFVGNTYFTYQPFYPHEFLYAHHRTYHRYYDDGRGLTRTKVTWMR